MSAPVTTPLPETLREQVASSAGDVDKHLKDARYVLPLLGEQGLIGTGVRDTARTIRALSAEDLATGFTLWASRCALLYLETAGTEYALSLTEPIRTGQRPGVSGMAGPFKDFTGAGEISLRAEKEEGGYRINGKLNWASNLYEDAIAITGAKTAEGHRFLFAFEAGHEGITFGKPFELLGLNATASAWVEFSDVFIPQEQILTEDFADFMPKVRPAFVLFQIAECLGVAEAATRAAATRLTGLNATFADDHAEVEKRVAEAIERHEDLLARVEAGGENKPKPVELLQLRLDAAQAAVDAANIEVRVAGGAGYAKSSPTSRRYREASFIPVQSPSEAQLRWELAKAKG
ncbi:acyl-CoA dehydrogenase family protein [Corynebacterium lowii]|uniref:Acyl-CoA dehydrogenase, short-chain specific n=1 Tax=Corynebacterium lowii TaxID=1544413 RepID=A0A0Q0TZT6_9CORY|nr:acyl-CoA dehydrogenase family protein [Corynebacterium lowii]KQB84821.1 Acyl-CoA dehydrogenase, short-chain specific [Corynebacterium lowii]MDP9851725.1 alkylation response protein AidB-like acyl-CoA dehydrogenase [Corynebacterium lowii]